MPPRLIFTEQALALTRRLRTEHGPLIFHLSGGCCEGSAPMCFRQSDFRVGPRDVLLGMVDDCPFYVGASQFDYWAYCQLTVDVTEGGGDSFSIEAADGVRFIVRSRLFTDEEAAALDAAGPPLRGPLPQRADAARQQSTTTSQPGADHRGVLPCRSR
ncbi:MAG TPA: DUF779 domain-containing protein [Rhodopila sp.]|uniref:DUF779 domain-containing protein n=1 Tax=Rhodopila sp. TaxID=2480087 RepID=UPI002B86A778|nr:DUF779 domain-containing protein [Rhodopila sp.]HVY16451.1 DUF779 domain-containing protein [Rhodopila sp.]